MNSLSVQQPIVDSPSSETLLKGRDITIDYLRAFVIVLVVYLHAAMAYASFSTYDNSNWVKSTAPVVDTVRWPILDWLNLYFDTFFMPLLFLISGLFVIPSLKRKGSKEFFIARLQRLGIPFVFGVLIIAPLAFLPSFLMAVPRPPTPYLFTFFTTDGWPVGPSWFLWVLLLLNGLVALVYQYAPEVFTKLRKQPTALVIFLVTIVSLLPLVMFLSHFHWISVGPFDGQPARFGLYLAYFLLGMALGTGRRWREIDWPKYWAVWLIIGIFSFYVYMIVLGEIFLFPRPVYQLMLGVTFSASCTGGSLAFLGAFRRFVHRSNLIFDSLSDNAYGIYLIHYAVVLWIQYVLLSMPWPAPVKFGVVFIGGTVLSWGITILARRIPAVWRVL